jgi:hypothetical protein
MKQQSLASQAVFERYGRKSRRGPVRGAPVWDDGGYQGQTEATARPHRRLRT